MTPAEKSSVTGLVVVSGWNRSKTSGLGTSSHTTVLLVTIRRRSATNPTTAATTAETSTKITSSRASFRIATRLETGAKVTGGVGWVAMCRHYHKAHIGRDRLPRMNWK